MQATFEELLVGEAFVVNNVIYTKLQPSYNPATNTIYNAMELITGRIKRFEKGEIVERRDPNS